MTPRAEIDVPTWWKYAAGAWPAFHDALSWAMDLRGEVLPPTLTPALKGTSGMVPLDRLAEELHRLPRTRWPAAAARYLADLDTAALSGTATGPAPDLTAARAQLLPHDAVPEGVRITVQVALDLVGTIILLEPSGDRWMDADDLAAWQMPIEEVWDIAVANLSRDGIEVSRTGAMAAVIGTDRLDVSGHALRLAELHDRPAPDGFLVGVPHPAVVLFTPIEGLDWLMVLRELPRILTGLYGGQFGKLSPEIHWVAGGRFERIRIDNTADQLSIAASEQFKAVVDRVIQAASQG